MSNALLIETFKENERDLIKFLSARLASVAVAEDLAQELFIKICNLDESVVIRNGKSYLFSMASNLAVDHTRRESRRRELLYEIQPVLAEGPHVTTPEQELISRDELVRLEQALAEVPEMSRRIFYLNRFELKSHREIGAIVGLSPAAVFKHIRRVLDHLAKVRDPG